MAATSIAGTLNGIDFTAFSAVYESAKGAVAGLTTGQVLSNFLIDQAIGLGVGIGLSLGGLAIGALRNGVSFDLGALFRNFGWGSDLFQLVGKEYEYAPQWRGMSEAEHAAYVREGIRDFYDWFVFKGGNPKIKFIDAPFGLNAWGEPYVGRLNGEIKTIYLTRGADGATLLEELLHAYQLIRDGNWGPTAPNFSSQKMKDFLEDEVKDLMAKWFGLISKH